MSFADFGYFLLFIGIAWIAITIPFDPTPLQGSLVLPTGLIIFGVLSIIKGIIDFEPLGKVLGYAFLIFIILLIRANGFLMIPMIIHGELTENYSNSFVITNGSPLSLNCDTCSLRLLSSPDNEVKALMNYTKNSEPVINQTSNSLSINLKNNAPALPEGEVNYLIPLIAGDVSVKAGVGSLIIDLNKPDSQSVLNINSGAGTINLTSFSTIGFKTIYVDAGVGSINLLIDGFNGSKNLELNTGVGSIDLFVSPGLVIQFDLNTGLGSVNNNYGSAGATEFNAATNKLVVKAHTGLGSINVVQVINSFEDCVAAGYPVLESYPEQCRTPSGSSFTRVI